MWVVHITGILKIPRRVKHNRKNWLHQYKQGGRMRDIDKWTTPQERNNFKIKIIIILKTKF
jgi:hypothetical protein